MTIAQQLNVKHFPFEIKDKNGKTIYSELVNDVWSKHHYDANGNQTRSEYSNGFWAERKYDEHGNQIYFEDSNGYIIDNRPKVELSMDEIAQKFGINVNQLKIKK